MPAQSRRSERHLGKAAPVYAEHVLDAAERKMGAPAPRAPLKRAAAQAKVKTKAKTADTAKANGKAQAKAKATGPGPGAGSVSPECEVCQYDVAPAVGAGAGQWGSLGLPAEELRLAVSLLSGMSFRWHRVAGGDGDGGDDDGGGGSGSDIDGGAGSIQKAERAAEPVQPGDFVGVVGPFAVLLRETAGDVLFQVRVARPFTATHPCSSRCEPLAARANR
jgi:hypothetical protein